MTHANNVRYRSYVEDYLIPVITLIKKNTNHTEAFKSIAKDLGVTKQTVNDRCARGIGLKTQQFVDLVNSGGIKQYLMNKFPDKADVLGKTL